MSSKAQNAAKTGENNEEIVDSNFLSFPLLLKYVAFCLVLDIGKSSYSSGKNIADVHFCRFKCHYFEIPGFSKSVITVATKLIQRKLYSEENDCLQIILIGSRSTGNPLGYSNVSIAK